MSELEKLYKEETQKKGAEFIWNRNKKMGIQSKSGVGSTLEGTQSFREWLPLMINKYGIKSIIDIPCGDWNWMSKVNLKGIKYHGMDIVEECIKDNRKKYSKRGIRFSQVDILNDDVDLSCDLIISRDFLFHLSIDSIHKVLEKFKNSGAKFLITTTFPNNIVANNSDLNDEQKKSGWGYRNINLDIEPFNLLEYKKEHVVELVNKGRHQVLYQFQ